MGGRTAKVTSIVPIYNPATGELIGDGHIEQEVRRGTSTRKPKREPFVMFTQRALAKIDLTGSQWRTLMALGARRDRSTGESRVLVREIAASFGVPAANVSRTLAELQTRGFIYKLGTGIYRINNHIAYAGDVATEALDPEPEWSRS